MKFLSLSLKDFAKGFIMAIITVVVTGLYTSLSAAPPHLPTASEWGTLGMMGLGSGIAYCMKNFLTNSEDQFLTKEPKK